MRVLLFVCAFAVPDFDHENQKEFYQDDAKAKEAPQAPHFDGFLKDVKHDLESEIDTQKATLDKLDQRETEETEKTDRKLSEAKEKLEEQRAKQKSTPESFIEETPDEATLEQLDREKNGFEALTRKMKAADAQLQRPSSFLQEDPVDPIDAMATDKAGLDNLVNKMRKELARPATSFIETGAPDSFADLDAKLKQLEENTKSELAKLKADAAPSSFIEKGTQVLSELALQRQDLRKSSASPDSFADLDAKLKSELAKLKAEAGPSSLLQVDPRPSDASFARLDADLHKEEKEFRKDTDDFALTGPASSFLEEEEQKVSSTDKVQRLDVEQGFKENDEARSEIQGLDQQFKDEAVSFKEGAARARAMVEKFKHHSKPSSFVELGEPSNDGLENLHVIQDKEHELAGRVKKETGDFKAAVEDLDDEEFKSDNFIPAKSSAEDPNSFFPAKSSVSKPSSFIQYKETDPVLIQEDAKLAGIEKNLAAKSAALTAQANSITAESLLQGTPFGAPKLGSLPPMSLAEVKPKTIIPEKEWKADRIKLRAEDVDMQKLAAEERAKAAKWTAMLPSSLLEESPNTLGQVESSMNSLKTKMDNEVEKFRQETQVDAQKEAISLKHIHQVMPSSFAEVDPKVGKNAMDDALKGLEASADAMKADSTDYLATIKKDTRDTPSSFAETSDGMMDSSALTASLAAWNTDIEARTVQQSQRSKHLFDILEGKVAGDDTLRRQA